MTRKAIRLSGTVLTCMVVVLAAFVGCGEEDISLISDDDEIRKYLTLTEEGRELFRVDGLVNPDTYSYNGVLHRDSIVFHERVVDIERLDSANYLPEFQPGIGQARFAEVEVEDLLTIQTRRIDGVDTTETTRDYVFLRSALFLKLGSDFREFAGWVMYGYNGNGPFAPARLTVTPDQGSAFPGDTNTYERYDYFIYNLSTQDYLRTTAGNARRFTTRHAYLALSDVETLAKGVELSFSSREVPTQSAYQLLSVETVDGFQTIRMTRTDATHYDAVVQTPPGNPRLWNVAYLQEYREAVGQPDGLSYKGWCVPYRVQQ